jgi:hypothetical protein
MPIKIKHRWTTQRGYKKLNYLKFDCRILFNMSSPSVFVL